MENNARFENLNINYINIQGLNESLKSLIENKNLKDLDGLEQVLDWYVFGNKINEQMLITNINKDFLSKLTNGLEMLKKNNVTLSEKELQIKLVEFIKIQSMYILNIANAINNYIISLNNFYFVEKNLYENRAKIDTEK